MTRNEFFENLKVAGLWDVGATIARTNALPLDKNSVFESYEDAVAYVEGPLAYPGQVVAVVEEAKTVFYGISRDMQLQPVSSVSSVEVVDAVPEFETAESNKLYIVYINDEIDLMIKGETEMVPLETSNEIASEETAGVVKSSSGPNRVSVNSDGTMEVKEISIDNIVGDDTVLILDGGGAPTIPEEV